MKSTASRTAFRRLLNETYPTPGPQYTVEQSRVQRGARVRPYGDYLWHQDREKFEAEYQEWCQRGMKPTVSISRLGAMRFGVDVSGWTSAAKSDHYVARRPSSERGGDE